MRHKEHTYPLPVGLPPLPEPLPKSEPQEKEKAERPEPFGKLFKKFVGS